MTKIEIKVQGSNAYAKLHDGPLTAGMVGVEAAFSFDSAWDGLNIIAKFRGGSTVKSRGLVGELDTTVPYEVLSRGGVVLEVGAEGRREDGSVVIPTVWAKVDQIHFGANDAAEEGREPTPTVYDDIMAAINAGKVKGPKGDPGPEGDPGEPGKDGVDIFAPLDTTEEQKAQAMENIGIDKMFDSTRFGVGAEKEGGILVENSINIIDALTVAANSAQATNMAAYNAARMFTSARFSHDAMLEIDENGIGYVVAVANDVDMADNPGSANAYVALALIDCPALTLNSTPFERYIVAKNGDTVEGKTVLLGAGVPNCVLVGTTLHITYSAKLSDGKWYLIHRTFNTETKEFGDNEICKLNVGGLNLIPDTYTEGRTGNYSSSNGNYYYVDGNAKWSLYNGRIALEPETSYDLKVYDACDDQGNITTLYRAILYCFDANGNCLGKANDHYTGNENGYSTVGSKRFTTPANTVSGELQLYTNVIVSDQVIFCKTEDLPDTYVDNVPIDFSTDNFSQHIAEVSNLDSMISANAQYAEKDGTYYCGVCIQHTLEYAPILTTTDFLTFNHFMTPVLSNPSQANFEAACYVYGGYLYYALRQYKVHDYLILAKITMNTKQVVEEITITDCNSRPCFFEHDGSLYLVHSMDDRKRTDFVKLHSTDLRRSLVTLQPSNCLIYPSVKKYGDDYYICSTGASSTSVYVRRITMGSYTHESIRKKIAKIFETFV